MPNDENWEREAGKVDPDGFEKLENLTRKLLIVRKNDAESALSTSKSPSDESNHDGSI